MAIKSLVSSAWQEISTLQIPVSGAYQDASCANALVSSAWQEVWSASDGGNYAFVDYGSFSHPNTTLNGDGSATVAFSWSAQSGAEGYFYISGDFVKGTAYKLSFTNANGFSGNMTISISSTSVSHTSTTGKNTVTITPTKSDSQMRVYFSRSGSSSGSFTAQLTNIAINGTKVKK